MLSPIKLNLRKWCIAVGLLLLSSIPICPQTPPSSSLPNEEAVLEALLSLKKDELATGLAVLKNHRQLITPRLWEQLLSRANSVVDPARSILTFQLAKEAARQLDDQRLLASTCYKAARFYFGQGDLPQAIEHYLESKRLFEEAGRLRDVLYVLSDLGTVCIYASDYTKAKEYTEQSLALADKLKGSNVEAGVLPDEYAIATALSNLGNLAKQEGQYEQALIHLQKSLQLYTALNQGSKQYTGDIIESMADIGRVYRVLGDHRQALTHLTQALEMARKSYRLKIQAGVLNSIGILYLEQRDHAKAVEFFQQSLLIYRVLNNVHDQARLLLNIGVAQQMQRRYEPAITSFRESLEKAEAVKNKEIIVAAKEGLGAVTGAQGDHRTALAWLEQGWQLATEINDQTRMAEILWRMAEVYLAKGEARQAIFSPNEALRMASALRLPNVTSLAATTLGQAYHAQKED